MSLDPGTLRGFLAPLFDPPGMPSGGIPDAVLAWGRAYVRYARSAIAGGAAPASLVPLSADGPDFISALDTAFRSMWTATVWAGPGIAGTTLLVPAILPFMAPAMGTLIASSDPQLAPTLIADALHTYTLSITVNVIPPTGTPFAAPLT